MFGEGFELHNVSRMLVAIDPGALLGWASFDEGVLTAAGLGAPPQKAQRVFIERPKIYPQGRQKARPEDIITLALCAGEWGGRFKDVGAKVVYVEPDLWKGGAISKEVHQPRIWRALDPRETGVLETACAKVAKSKQNNIVDAVGIGLYAVGRQA